ncbi:hypothetical protein [Akkermansia sp.]|uniref:hypothetical protein n=1 Tax=Akkermansia sp. TaxID=1872421 RepID=UPI0025C4D334|nr:hypothetical protein [Akkermansia sp.]
MKKHYFYSIPCFALTCALAACSDDNKSSSAKAGQDAAGLTPAAALDPSAPVASDLVAKRAERLGLAALFPRDMGMVAGVYDIPGIIKSVQNLNMVKTWGNCSAEQNADESVAIPGEDAPKPVRAKCSVNSPVIDAMIGFGPEWAPWMDSAQSAFTGMGLNQMQGMLSAYKLYQASADGAKKDNSAEMEAMVNRYAEMLVQWVDSIDLRPSQAATAPVMVAAKLTPEAVAQAKATLKDANLPEDMELHGIVSLYDKTYNGLACKVAEVDCKKLRAKLEEELEKAKDNIKVSQENMNRLKAALQRLDESKLYVAVGFVDDTLVGFVTTNPEKQVRLAASPQDSVLARPDFSMADAQLQYPAYGLIFADKACAKGLINLDIAYYKGMFTGLKDLMQTVGTDWKIADLAPSMTALDSMKGSLLGLYEKVAQNATPVSYYAWQDQGVHVEACTYPLEFYLLDAPSSMNSVRPGTDTVLYSSFRINPQIVDMGCTLYENIAQIVWDYGNAYISNPKHDVSDQIRMVAPMLQMARPTLEELWKAYKTALSGITDSGAYIVDMKGAPSPMLKNVPAPRFSLVYEVKNRAALGEAWQKVSDAAKTIVTLASQGKMTELPAPKSSVEGDVTTYDYECPLGADLNPVVAVTDTRWAVSMPKAFGMEVIKESMKAPGQVAPLEFQFNLVPVRDALKTAAEGNKDIQKAVKTLDVITSDVTGVHATGRKGADGRDVYHIHVISAK